MKRLLTIIAIATGFSFSAAQADSLDQLLDQVRSGSLQKTKAAAALESKFRSAANKAGIIASLKADRTQLEARSEVLEAQYAANDESLNGLRSQRQVELGDLKDLFGSLQQIVGENQAAYETSIISAQFPGRDKFLSEISTQLTQSNELISIDDIEKVWSGMLNEMVQQGKVSTFAAPVATASGSKEERQVTRVGVFSLVSEGKFLTFGTGGVAELARQPEGQYLSTVSDLQGASAGESVEFAVDPTRGTLLAANVERPTLMEQANQGGFIGYVIIALGFVTIAIAIIKIFSVTTIASAVNKQAANIDNPSSKNPLGRVLTVFKDNPNSDTEALELKLSEAIMKETPKLNSWLVFLKVVAAIAPLMGLLGTVWGMIGTFQAITLFGAGDPKLMAGGISQALVTTVLGLCVAIPTILLHTAAASKAKRVQEVLEEQSAGMVARQVER